MRISDWSSDVCSSDLLIIREGQIFSRRLIDRTSDSISLALSNIGYAFARVNVVPEIDREKRTVGINLNVLPGPRTTVRHILFKGNTRSADEVLRRELRQRSEEHTSELQSLMRISYAVFCLKKKNKNKNNK